MTIKGYGLSLCTSALLIITLGCGKKNSGSTDVPSFPPTADGPPELAYCSSVRSYSGSVTITGSAGYEYRAPNGSGLGGVEAVPRPIRYAEVRVLDSAGKVAQCSETDINGDFSFTLPQGSASYSVQVNSRSNNANLIATVFDLPETKNFYSLSTTVKPTASKSVGNLVAPADGTVLGGAFNILDQLLNSNEYLRAQASDCSDDFDGCKDFTVTPKIEVFWKKGFNPGSYFDSDPLSFYLPGYGRLFILGGVNGDVNYSDTDHFDNSVIIHEFGHFLEDKMFGSDSPGGSHNGQKIIDPRLAWSEGWGNFIQAAVQNDPHYIDTIGNTDGQTELAFYVRLEDKTMSIDQPNGTPTHGEGNFREFSVTRLLWDAIDNVGIADEVITDGFAEIWSALTNATSGFKASSSKFKDVGLFHKVQDGMTGSSDWSSLRTLEFHIGDRTEYATYVTARAACATLNPNTHNFEITPVMGGSSFSTVDLFRNNDFFHYKASSAQSNVRFRLQYSAAGNLADLDLYLYNESARFGYDEDILGRSDSTPSGTGTQSELITIATLPKGDYLINVFAYVGENRGIGSANTYKIQISTNGSSWTNLCEP